jgi:hypothetical protein
VCVCVCDISLHSSSMTLRLFPYLSCCEWCCSEHGSADVVMRWFTCLWAIASKRIATFSGSSVLMCLILFSLRIKQSAFPSTVHEGSAFPTHSQHSFGFLWKVTLMDVRWCFMEWWTFASWLARLSTLFYMHVYFSVILLSFQFGSLCHWVAWLLNNFRFFFLWDSCWN